MNFAKGGCGTRKTKGHVMPNKEEYQQEAKLSLE